MKQSITIRHAIPRDTQNIVQEWGNVYKKALKYKFPDRWKWQFENNPFLTEVYQNKYPIWIALDQQEVVGWSCAMIVTGKILEYEKPFAFGVDMHVKKAYRKAKVGLRLQKENQSNHKVFISIQMSEGSRAIKLKIGGKPGAMLNIYYKLINRFDENLLYKNFLRKIKSKKLRSLYTNFHNSCKGLDFVIVSRILSYLVKQGQIRPNPNSFRDSNKYSFDKIERFNDEADEFWGRIKNSYGFSVKRDKAYLNWRYVDQPQISYFKYYLKENDEVVGVVIFRAGLHDEINYGAITELIAIDDDPRKYNALLQFAEHKLNAMGVTSIRCAASLSEQQEVLQNNGFQHFEIKVPVVYVDPSDTMIDYDTVYRSRWLLSLGDQDMDIPLLNQQPDLFHIISVIRKKVPGQSLLCPW